MRIFYLVTGLLSLMLGFIGALIPLLPSFPFLLLSAYCFGRSSQKLHTWFMSTKLYKNNLESYVKGEGLKFDVKVRLVIMISLALLIGFMLMPNIFWFRVVLVVVWFAHLLYFKFGVETIKEKGSLEP